MLRRSAKYTLSSRVCSVNTPGETEILGCRSPPVLRPRLTGTELVVKSFPQLLLHTANHRDDTSASRSAVCRTTWTGTLFVCWSWGRSSPMLSSHGKAGFLNRPGWCVPKKKQSQARCECIRGIRKFDVFFFFFFSFSVNANSHTMNRQNGDGKKITGERKKVGLAVLLPACQQPRRLNLTDYTEMPRDVYIWCCSCRARDMLSLLFDWLAG